MLQKKLSSLSIFLPVYQDEKTVSPLTESCVQEARKLTDDFEILLINDGSTDGSGSACDGLARSHGEVRVIHHEKNQGIGKTMMEGYLQCTKDYVFYTDGDAQYDVRELPQLVEHIREYDAVVGYRVKRVEGWLRVLISRGFHALIFMLFGLRHKDIDCSQKLLKRDFLRKVRFRTRSALVDFEILMHAKLLKVPVKEVPVKHYPRQYGKSQCLRVRLIFSMFADMLWLRWKYYR